MADLAETCGNTRGLRDALLVRIMSDCLLRVSEAEALGVSDVEFVRDGLLVTIRRSKTDQEGRALRSLPGRRRRVWRGNGSGRRGSTGGRCSGRSTRRGGWRARACRGAASGTSSRNARRMPGSRGRVSGHSLRVGSAQSLRDAGATVTEPMDAGRWTRVDTMAGYVRAQDAAFGPVARLRFGVVPPDAGVRGARRAPRRGAGRAGVEGERARRERKQMRRAAKKSRKGLRASKEP